MVLFVLGLDGHPQPANLPATWKTFEDRTVGVSFRYPRALRVESRDVHQFNIEGLVAAIDLISESEGETILRFMITDPRGNRMAVDYTPEFLHRVCKTYRRMRVDSRDAANCVTCGSGGCEWTVHVFGYPQVEVFTGVADERYKPAPDDATFPLLTIIKSLRVSDRPGRADRE